MTRHATRHSRRKIEKALDMMRAGRSRGIVSRQLRIPVATLRYHAIAAGIQSPRSYSGHRTAFRPGSRPYTSEDDATIRALVAEGKNYQQIANILRRQRSSIRVRLMTLRAIEQRGDTPMNGDDNA